MRRVVLILALMLMTVFISLDASHEYEMCGESQNQDSCQAYGAHNRKHQDEEIIRTIVDLDRYPIHQRGPSYDLWWMIVTGS